MTTIKSITAETYLRELTSKQYFRVKLYYPGIFNGVNQKVKSIKCNIQLFQLVHSLSSKQERGNYDKIIMYGEIYCYDSDEGSETVALQ